MKSPDTKKEHLSFSLYIAVLVQDPGKGRGERPFPLPIQSQVILRLWTGIVSPVIPVIYFLFHFLGCLQITIFGKVVSTHPLFPTLKQYTVSCSYITLSYKIHRHA